MDNRTAELKAAIDRNDLELVKQLMMDDPSLHRAPMGYGNNGPLTWVAECRVPWEPPSSVRLAMAEWMIANGSDVHQGGDGPLMRAALNGDRTAMMELLVRHGADVNAFWNGNFPIIFAPCESINRRGLKWLLEHGAKTEGALDYLIGTYARSSDLATCIDLLLEAGAVTRYNLPGVLNTIRDRTDQLAEELDASPDLVNRHFPELDCGTTAARRLTLEGATLLHVAAEYGSIGCGELLLRRGASPNAKGGSGQTPVFHSASQYGDFGLEVTRLLLNWGTDLAIRANVPGQYDCPDHFVECTVLEYAAQFPGPESYRSNPETLNVLREFNNKS